MTIFEVKDPQNLDNLKSMTKKIIGFECGKYSDSFLSRRFESRLRKNNIDSYTSYGSILKGSVDEQEALKKELTIHVTHFFRDTSLWREFREKIIPMVIENKKSSNEKLIRVWSAGCSTGEEPISIAICFREKLKEDINRFRVSILATDYDDSIISRAKEALYEENQFRETDDKIKRQYFTKTAGYQYLANDSIRSMIKYSSGDLLSNMQMPKNIDILFCRNTVIYFNKEAKTELYTEFFDLLNPGGFFIMGKTECLDGPSRNMFIALNPIERIYVKPGKMNLP